jgi:flagellar motor switch protein FliM
MSETGASHVRPFDFRSPCRLSLPVESRLVDWQRRAARLLPQKWLTWVPGETAWTCPSPETIDCATAELPEQVAVFQVDVAGQTQPALLAISGELAVPLVLSVLGDQVESVPERRVVTPVEMSILELLVAQTIEALNEGGIGAGYPKCELVGAVPRPVPMRIFPLEENLVVLRFCSRFAWGDGALQWIWPESMAEGLFVDTTPLADATAEDSRVLAAVAQRLPFEIRVRLGGVKLSVAELATLSEGDVLILDQKITEPLTCHVGHQPLLKAWPTVTGNRQSIQIASVDG